GSGLRQKSGGRRAPVKAMLMDQRVIAGLGNIYACEALFRASIDPRKPAGKVSRAKLDALAQAIPSVLEEAIAAGGSPLARLPTATSAISPRISPSMIARASPAPAGAR